MLTSSCGIHYTKAKLARCEVGFAVTSAKMRVRRVTIEYRRCNKVRGCVRGGVWY